MALLDDYAQHVTRLSARTKLFNDHLQASRKETAEQLKARTGAMKQSWDDGTDALGEDMTKSKTWMTDHFTGLREAVSTDVDAMRAASDKRQTDRAADSAERDAEVATAYATAANAMATQAVNESERSSIEALAARAASDALVSK